MKTEDDLKFPFYTRPYVYFLCVIGLALVAGFIIYMAEGERPRQNPRFIRMMYNFAGGFGLIAILAMLQGLRLEFSIDRPHIIFNESEVSMPVGWFGLVKTVRLDELVDASLEHDKENRLIVLERESGKSIKLAETYFFSRQDFEECWSVLDAVCQNRLSLADARAGFQVRLLCTICGTAVLKTESVYGKCSECDTLTVSDVRMMGAGVVLVGIVFVLIGAISVVYTMIAGWGWMFVGVAALGLGLIGTGLCIVFTGKISTSSQAILRSTGFWRK